jgi:hypothetical protein
MPRTSVQTSDLILKLSLAKGIETGLRHGGNVQKADKNRSVALLLRLTFFYSAQTSTQAHAPGTHSQHFVAKMQALSKRQAQKHASEDF